MLFGNRFQAYSARHLMFSLLAVSLQQHIQVLRQPLRILRLGLLNLLWAYGTLMAPASLLQGLPFFTKVLHRLIVGGLPSTLLESLALVARNTLVNVKSTRLLATLLTQICVNELGPVVSKKWTYRVTQKDTTLVASVSMGLDQSPLLRGLAAGLG